MTPEQAEEQGDGRDPGGNPGGVQDDPGVGRPPIGWRVVRGPWFDNQVATLELDGRGVGLRIERVPPGHQPDPRLEPVLDHRLAEAAASP